MRKERKHYTAEEKVTMLDAEVVAVSPSSVWRVLQHAGLLSPWKGQPFWG
jgi:hypothetical protein